MYCEEFEFKNGPVKLLRITDTEKLNADIFLEPS